MNISLFILLCLLQIADVCTTALIIRRGLGREGNSFVADNIKAFGLVPGLVLPKILVLVPCWLTVKQQFAEPWLAALQTGILAAIGASYVWVVVHNWRILRGR